MEARDGLRLVNPGVIHRRMTNVTVGVRCVSPDANTIVYWAPVYTNKPSQMPTLVAESVAEGTRSIALVRQQAYLCGISAGARVIVVAAASLETIGRRSLLALNLVSGLVDHDLSTFATRVALSDLERISVSGQGSLVALGSRQEIQVVEIPTGNTVFDGPGRFPKLSADGKRLAFIKDERLYVSALDEGVSKEVLPGVRVMGAGSWSPDGSFLAAGAWTSSLALEKRQIVVEIPSGDYAIVGKLGDGDYGDQFAWMSAKLVSP